MINRWVPDNRYIVPYSHSVLCIPCDTIAAHLVAHRHPELPKSPESILFILYGFPEPEQSCQSPLNAPAHSTSAIETPEPLVAGSLDHGKKSPHDRSCGDRKQTKLMIAQASVLYRRVESGGGTSPPGLL